MEMSTTLSLEIDRLPRDMLRDFISVTTDNCGDFQSGTIRKDDCMDGDNESEIELNLGLSLGGRFGLDKASEKLKRSSSVVGTMPILLEQDECSTNLTRTTSLPAVTEEEWRKRKEMQTMRRMEAKRRRCGKHKSYRGSQTTSFGLLKKSPSSLDQQGLSNGSIITDQKSDVSEGKANPPSEGEGSNAAAGDMPCVFVKGEGPKGKRVEGILYKYGKGEAVRIMCICHGHFHSPADFVKHAGGGDVDHPLRHIVVITPSMSL